MDVEDITVTRAPHAATPTSDKTNNSKNTTKNTNNNDLSNNDNNYDIDDVDCFFWQSR